MKESPRLKLCWSHRARKRSFVPSKHPLPCVHHCTGHFPAHGHLHHKGWEEETVKVQEEEALCGSRWGYPEGQGEGKREAETEEGLSWFRARQWHRLPMEPLVKMKVAFFRCGGKQAWFWAYLDAYFSLQSRGYSLGKEGAWQVWPSTSVILGYLRRAFLGCYVANNTKLLTIHYYSKKKTQNPTTKKNPQSENQTFGRFIFSLIHGGYRRHKCKIQVSMPKYKSGRLQSMDVGSFPRISDEEKGVGGKSKLIVLGVFWRAFYKINIIKILLLPKH